METHVWAHFCTLRDHKIDCQGILSFLSQEGLNTHPLDLEGGPGLLFFDEIDESACDFVRKISRGGQERVLAISLSRSVVPDGCAWQLLHAGASDVCTWTRCPQFVSCLASRFKRWMAIEDLCRSPAVQATLIGKSPAWRSVLRQIVEIARFTDASVLILGESGTGKELFSHLIHALDARQGKRDLVVVDCTTIVPELSGSEFFGHERGAFTGAVSARDGAFALADGGTLFLDEVGELSLPLQAQLLRVVQERTYKRVGSNSWQRTHFRLVCATNRDLPQEVQQGRFRADLYYRIANWVCRIPPLRERPEDILPLALFFLREFHPGKQAIDLDDTVRDYLLRRAYPGNVRELKQLMSAISYRHVGEGPISVGDIPDQARFSDGLTQQDWRSGNFEQAIRYALALGVGLKEISQSATEAAIRIAVSEEEGNLQRAARKLGVTDRALQMRRANQRSFDQPGTEASADTGY